MQEKKLIIINRCPKITGKSIYLRSFTENDISRRYINWLNDPQVNVFLSTRNIKQNYKSVQNYIKSFIKCSDKLLLGIFLKKTNLHIGNITFCPIDWKNNFSALGICIGDKKYWHKGLAREALIIAIEFGFNQLKLHRLEAGINSMNKTSLKLFQSLGFKKEGILRQREKMHNTYINGIYLGLLESEKYSF